MGLKQAKIKRIEKPKELPNQILSSTFCNKIFFSLNGNIDEHNIFGHHSGLMS